MIRIGAAKIMDPQSGTSKWELVRNAFANAAKNGWGALKLHMLFMRGTFIREHIVPTTVVTRALGTLAVWHISVLSIKHVLNKNKKK